MILLLWQLFVGNTNTEGSRQIVHGHTRVPAKFCLELCHENSITNIFRCDSISSNDKFIDKDFYLIIWNLRTLLHPFLYRIYRHLVFLYLIGHTISLNFKYQLRTQFGTCFIRVLNMSILISVQEYLSIIKI